MSHVCLFDFPTPHLLLQVLLVSDAHIIGFWLMSKSSRVWPHSTTSPQTSSTIRSWLRAVLWAAEGGSRSSGRQRAARVWWSERGSGWCPSCARMERGLAATEAGWLATQEQVHHDGRPRRLAHGCVLSCWCYSLPSAGKQFDCSSLHDQLQKMHTGGTWVVLLQTPASNDQLPVCRDHTVAPPFHSYTIWSTLPPYTPLSGHQIPVQQCNRIQ
jgi:hypothetical protein